MRKAPYRSKNEITQSYNDGLVTVYSITDVSKPGYKPSIALLKKIELRYEEQRLGIQRYYQGMQNQVQIDRVIRTQMAGDINSQDVAITEDGKQYRINLVQVVSNSYPLSVDITLQRIDQKYEVHE